MTQLRQGQRRRLVDGRWYDLITVHHYVAFAFDHKPANPERAVWSCIDEDGRRFSYHEDLIGRDEVVMFSTYLSIEYAAVEKAYGDRKAERSGLPYMRHIDQGLVILDKLTNDDDVLRAWCAHPLFQLDNHFVELMATPHRTDPLCDIVTNPRVAVLAMEYRAVANGFLSKDHAYLFEHEGMPRPKISPLPEVNQMLVADKVQNYRDARLHVFPDAATDDEAACLTVYFNAWFKALGVGEFEIARYERLLERHEKDEADRAAAGEREGR